MMSLHRVDEDSKKELYQLLSRGCSYLGLTLNVEQQEQLISLITLLNRWSIAYNLTAVRDPKEMVTRHLLDSLALYPYLKGNYLFDLGTGPGFPGLPLAILHPEWRFVLLDSNGKKMRFVRHALLELGIFNVDTVRMRIESYPLKQKFATIVTRAFAPLSDILRMTHRLLQPDGVLLASKGPNVKMELDDLDAREVRYRLHRLQIPFLEAERSLVEIRLGGDWKKSTIQR